MRFVCRSAATPALAGRPACGRRSTPRPTHAACCCRLHTQPHTSAQTGVETLSWVATAAASVPCAGWMLSRHTVRSASCGQTPKRRGRAWQLLGRRGGGGRGGRAQPGAARRARGRRIRQRLADHAQVAAERVPRHLSRRPARHCLSPWHRPARPAAARPEPARQLAQRRQPGGL